MARGLTPNGPKTGFSLFHNAPFDTPYPRRERKEPSCRKGAPTGGVLKCNKEKNHPNPPKVENVILKKLLNAMSVIATILLLILDPKRISFGHISQRKTSIKKFCRLSCVLFFTPFLCVPFIVRMFPGNILFSVVLTRRELRNSFNLLLVALAFFDSVYMIAAIFESFR